MRAPEPAVSGDALANFARIHKTLRVTPAMEAGIADRVWEIKEIVNLTDV